MCRRGTEDTGCRSFTEGWSVLKTSKGWGDLAWTSSSSVRSLGVVRGGGEDTGIGRPVAVKEGPSDGSCGHRRRSSPSRTRTQQRRGWGRRQEVDLLGGLVAMSCLTLVTPWTVARQAPLSMGFSRQEYCSRVPFPSPGDLPHPAVKPESPALDLLIPVIIFYKVTINT